MPIAPYRHNLEKSADGMDWFIIRTPRPISRVIMNVRFTEGEGRTKYPEKAKAFVEQFGYECLLPQGYPEWKFAKIEDSSEPEKFEWEYHYDIVNEEGEEIEEIDSPSPKRMK